MYTFNINSLTTSISNSFKLDNTIENDPTYIADKFSEFSSEIGPKYASKSSNLIVDM